MRYAVVIEQAQHNYSAYVPDLPGCIATGDTVSEVQQAIREAIELCISRACDRTECHSRRRRAKSTT